MTPGICILALFGCLVCGIRWPGVLLAGIFLTYQSKIIVGNDYIGVTYVLGATAVVVVQAILSQRPIRFIWLDAAFLVLIAWMCATPIYSEEPKIALEVAQKLATSSVVYVIGRTTDPQRMRGVMIELCVGLLAAGSVLSLLLVGIAHRGSNLNVVRFQLNGGSAVGISQPLPYEFIAGLVCAFTALQLKKPLLLGLAIGALLIDLYVSLESATRGVFLAQAVGLVVFIFAYRRELRLSNLALFLPVLAVAALLILPNLFEERGLDVLTARLFQNFSHTGERDLSSYGRIFAYRLAIEMFGAHPVLGVGIGGFSIVDPFNGYPHDLFLEVAAEFGFVGLCLLASYLVSLTGVMNSIRQRQDLLVGSIMLAMFAAAFTAQLVSFAFFMQRPLFLLTGLAAAFASARQAARATPVLAPALSRAR